MSGLIQTMQMRQSLDEFGRLIKLGDGILHAFEGDGFDGPNQKEQRGKTLTQQFVGCHTRQVTKQAIGLLMAKPTGAGGTSILVHPR